MFGSGAYRVLSPSLPVIKARKALSILPKGQVLILEATDPLAEIDIPHFIASEGHRLLAQSREERVFIFHIEVKGASAQ
ncbi:MAG: sulfurtransferase TusA family protein [Alphaproteobacteria bacterium]|nr:sulfurtransferase TusA family protein [Alphaproteobacteria bacterium]